MVTITVFILLRGFRRQARDPLDWLARGGRRSELDRPICMSSGKMD